MVKRFMRAATNRASKQAEESGRRRSSDAEGQSETGVKDTALVGRRRTAALSKGRQSQYVRSEVGAKNMRSLAMLTVRRLDKATSRQVED